MTVNKELFICNIIIQEEVVVEEEKQCECLVFYFIRQLK